MVYGTSGRQYKSLHMKWIFAFGNFRLLSSADKDKKTELFGPNTQYCCQQMSNSPEYTTYIPLFSCTFLNIPHYG